MRRIGWLIYLWPGLPQLWREGSWSALALAGGFALLLNLLLASTFVWTELLSTRLRFCGWLAAAAACLVAGLGSYGRQNRSHAAAVPGEPDLFQRARAEYLRRNWLQAANLLGELLRRDASDVEARLLLVAVYRQGERWEEARNELTLLERREASARWRREMAIERRRLEASGQDRVAKERPTDRATSSKPSEQQPGLVLPSSPGEVAVSKAAA